MQHYAEIEQLLESGAHFGHLTRRWNPKMEKFIFMERNGIHIIDLRKTQVLIDIAREALYNIASTGKIVLFVGTKLQAKGTIEQQALRCKMNYVCERWLGGMLTNFMTIRKSIKRLTSIDKMEVDGTFDKITKKERLLLTREKDRLRKVFVDGTFDKITKKERLLLTREKDRLRKVFGGIEEMNRLPGALFIVDIKKEHIAVKEAKILGIPVFAIVDTNTDPEEIDYPIPANDDSYKTIELVSKIMADAVLEGSEVAKRSMADMSADDDRVAKESDASSEDQSKVKRKFRERRGGRRDMEQNITDEHAE